MPLGLLVGQTTLERPKQKTPKAPFFPRHAPKRFLLEEILKKRLSEVLRVVCVVASAAQIRVDWPPMDVAQLRQRRVCTRLGCRTGGDNNAPSRLFEAILRLVRCAD